jgi:predicted RNase H-like HicB family nuclease
VSKRYVLSEYVERAMAEAVYDKLEDGTFSARIPLCPGVIAFAPSLKESEEELRSTVEDWIPVSLKFRHPLPIIGTIDLSV